MPQTELQAMVDSLRDLDTAVPELEEVRGLTIGAIFSILEADVVSGTELLPEDQAELTEDLEDVLASLRNGEKPTRRRWLAGFYLNSAILRLAFASERSLAIIAPQRPAVDDPAVGRLCRRRGKKRSFCYLIEDAKSDGVITPDEAHKLHELRQDVDAIKHHLLDVHKRQIRDREKMLTLLGVIRKLLNRAAQVGGA